MRKTDINAIKAFVESRHDTRRFAYDRFAKTVPRHCTLAITVNDDHFLRDMTGNRRFWILHSPLPKFGYIKSVNGESITDDAVVDQIWAEVFHLYNELFAVHFDESKLALSRESEIAAEQIAELYIEDYGGIEGELQAFLDVKILPPFLWDLLSKAERHDFFLKGFSHISDAEADLIARRTSGKKANFKEDCAAIRSFLHSDFTRIVSSHGRPDDYFLYGSELRQHICAAEVLNEAFNKTDRRKSPQLINDLLNRLDGWALGNRLQKRRPAQSFLPHARRVNHRGRSR